MKEFIVDINMFLGPVKTPEDYQILLQANKGHHTEDELLDKLRMSDHFENLFGFFTYCNGITLREFLEK